MGRGGCGDCWESRDAGKISFLDLGPDYMHVWTLWKNQVMDTLRTMHWWYRSCISNRSY